MKLAPFVSILWLLAGLNLVTGNVQAQWVSQTFVLKQGWNAIYLHVDPSHETLHNLVGPGAAVATPIEQVWMWNPAPGTAQFVQNPQDPLTSASQWISWTAVDSANSALQRLIANVAYLVYSNSATDFVWTVKGQPRLPTHQWTSSGLNFVGFPTVEANPVNLEAFLAPVPALQQNTEIFEYPGGEFGANNPSRVFALRTTPTQRGQAFWVRPGSALTRYYGPFEIRAASADGVQFGSLLGTARVRIRNLSPDPLTVTLEHLASEMPPAGQTPIAGAVPLLVRGGLNQQDLTYSYSSLLQGNNIGWSLAAVGQSGSEVEVVLGVNRSVITANPGELLAGILRFTDSLGHSSIDLPVTASAGSNAGLWVGNASITKVRSFLKTYQRDASGAPVVSTQSNDFGSYVTTSVNQNLGDVPRRFPLRLIVHNDGTNVRLLQRVYHGLDAGASFVNSTQQGFLDASQLGTARRISSVHLPFTATNQPWPFAGALQPGATLTTTVNTAHDDHRSNPFLHTYHPDHDNLGANFNTTPLPTGFESYRISRAISLAINPPANDFASLTRSGQRYTGVYSETLTLEGKQTAQGLESRSYETQGTFTLNRINSIATLRTQ